MSPYAVFASHSDFRDLGIYPGSNADYLPNTAGVMEFAGPHADNTGNPPIIDLRSILETAGTRGGFAIVSDLGGSNLVCARAYAYM
jgi:hypothetical protein